jgi:transposase
MRIDRGSFFSERGESRGAIAESLGITSCIISKWRERFIGHRIDRLFDRIRPGKLPRYNEATQRRILEILDKTFLPVTAAGLDLKEL